MKMFKSKKTVITLVILATVLSAYFLRYDLASAYFTHKYKDEVTLVRIFLKDISQGNTLALKQISTENSFVNTRPGSVEKVVNLIKKVDVNSLKVRNASEQEEGIYLTVYFENDIYRRLDILLERTGNVILIKNIQFSPYFVGYDFDW